MSDNNLEDVINGVINDVTANAPMLCMQAFNEASERGLKEMYKEALRLFDAYYASYDPRWYTRTGQLPKSVGFNKQFSKTKNKLRAKIWLEYDPSVLHYTGGSKKNPRSVDSNWVLSNVLNGIHINGVPDRMKDEAPNHIMEIEKFRDILADKLSGYFNDNLLNIIASKFVK